MDDGPPRSQGIKGLIGERFGRREYRMNPEGVQLVTYRAHQFVVGINPEQRAGAAIFPIFSIGTRRSSQAMIHQGVDAQTVPVAVHWLRAREVIGQQGRG